MGFFVVQKRNIIAVTWKQFFYIDKQILADHSSCPGVATTVTRYFIFFGFQAHLSDKT